MYTKERKPWIWNLLQVSTHILLHYLKHRQTFHVQTIYQTTKLKSQCHVNITVYANNMRQDLTQGWNKLHMICTPHKILLWL